jgi:hypothetical protein
MASPTPRALTVADETSAHSALDTAQVSLTVELPQPTQQTEQQSLARGGPLFPGKHLGQPAELRR